MDGYTPGACGGDEMSLKNLTRKQLAEDYYWGDAEDRVNIAEELQRRDQEREERACRAEESG